MNDPAQVAAIAGGAQCGARGRPHDVFSLEGLKLRQYGEWNNPRGGWGWGVRRGRVSGSSATVGAGESLGAGVVMAGGSGFGSAVLTGGCGRNRSMSSSWRSCSRRALVVCQLPVSQAMQTTEAAVTAVSSGICQLSAPRCGLSAGGSGCGSCTATSTGTRWFASLRSAGSANTLSITCSARRFQ